MTDTNKLTSNDIKPGPFSEHELREQWNSQADKFNQWDSLDSYEQLAWAQTCAIEADRKENQKRLYRLQQENSRFREPERTILCDLLANGELLPDPCGTRYGLKTKPTPPAEGEVASDRISSEQWTQKALEAMEQLIFLREYMIFIRDITPKTPALSRNRWDRESKAAYKEKQAQIRSLYDAISIIHSMVAARPLELWNDDDGDVLWWVFPIQEPPYVGSPLDSEWPGYHTHWTPLPPLPLDPDGVLPAVEDSRP